LEERYNEIREIDGKFQNRFEREFHVKILVIVEQEGWGTSDFESY